MFKQSGLDTAEARSRIIIANWGSQDKAPGGFLQLDDLLGKGRLEKEENFDGPLSNETTLLCYSSGTTGKPKGVEVMFSIIYRNSRKILIYYLDHLCRPHIEIYVRL